MTEDRLDGIRLDYIAERSDHGRAAVEALRSSRAEYLQKAYGKKDKKGQDIVAGSPGEATLGAR